MWAVLRFSLYIKEDHTILGGENSDFRNIWRKHISSILCIRKHACILHTKKPKANLKYFCCRRNVVNNDSGIQSSQRYINVFSIKKIENPLCKKLQ